jgi:hypothetical protein
MKIRHQQKFILLTIILIIGLNLPIVLLFDTSKNLFGFPAIYIYIFSLWAISILISIYFIKKYHE